jgi:MerR family redox-sensitive transcriptional activator SoxR
MAEFTISEVARQANLRPSAIRYYERIRILPPARRVSGQRRYEMGAVYRLAVVRRAQAAGFTLDEIRRLFFGFAKRATASQRWRTLAEHKIAELDSRIEELQRMKDVIERLRARCQCDTLDQCGKAMVKADTSACEC